jgi:hypothetical protein
VLSPIRRYHPPMTAKAPDLDALLLAAWDSAPVSGASTPEELAMIEEGMKDLAAGRVVSSAEVTAMIERKRVEQGG